MKSFLRKLGRFLWAPVRHWRVTLTIIIAVIVLDVIVGQVLLSRLAAQREAIRASGGHLSFKDFALDIEDRDNAAVFYRYAAAIQQQPGIMFDDMAELLSRYVASGMPPEDRPESVEKEDEDSYRPLTSEEEALVAAFVAQNARMYDVIREANTKKACQFGDYEKVSENPGYSVPTIPRLDLMRDLTRKVAFRAIWEARHGNLPGAYEWVGTGLHMTNAFCNDPLLIAGLMRCACAGIMLDALRTLLCEGNIPDPLPESLVVGLAAAADRSKAGAFYEGERCFSNAILETQSEQTGWFAASVWLTANQLRINDTVSQIMTAVMEPDYVNRKAILDGLALGNEGKPSVLRPDRIVADILRPAIERSMESYERAIAEALGAQIAVALKQYKAKNAQYPDQLSALTPDFMKELLVDPFCGEPFRYQRDGEGFVLYSVGQDGADDGGKRVHKRLGDIVWRVTK